LLPASLGLSLLFSRSLSSCCHHCLRHHSPCYL
jgi:hypothetical protein